MEEKIQNPYNLSVEEMAKAGVHLGHSPSKTHPKMKPFIFGLRNHIHIIDLEKAIPKFEEALKFLENLSKERKTILFVSTKPPLREMVENFAKELGFPYIVNRWLGGTFTNFSEIKARVETLKELERQRESGELEKYTKKERMLIERKIKKLNEKFGGLKTLENLPDAVFIVDLVRDNLAAKEAKRRKIPVIAICDTNANPELADYFFPANDDALPAVSFILSKVKEAILRGRGQQ